MFLIWMIDYIATALLQYWVCQSLAHKVTWSMVLVLVLESAICGNLLVGTSAPWGLDST